jgi:hypothetical protein
MKINAHFIPYIIIERQKTFPDINTGGDQCKIVTENAVAGIKKAATELFLES